MTVRQAAEYLHITPGRVRHYIAEQRLPAEQLHARTLLLKREDVEAFAATRRPAGRPRAPRPAREGDGG